MATLDTLNFEMERRGIVFHYNITMPDNTQLGYVGNPNNITSPITDGESLLYYSPSGTKFLDKYSTPHVRWCKVADGAGGLWVNEDASPDVVTVNAFTNLGGGRLVIVFNNNASYADNVTNYIGQLGLTLVASVENADVTVKLSGVVSDPAWTFTNGPIWLAQNGLMTQAEPQSGASLIIGFANSTNSLLFKPQIVIER